MNSPIIDPTAFYRDALGLLLKSNVPFLLGGAYALGKYTDIHRDTKDLDVFVKRDDCQRALDAFEAAGYETELTFPHWLGKAFFADHYVDVIFNSGNAIAEVDDEWFKFSAEGQVFGHTVKICAPEEIIWSKGFIMERERFDGADVAHLMKFCIERMDWSRLLQRFGEHWRVLLTHIILFGFIYPADRTRIPEWVVNELMSRLQSEMKNIPPTDKLCQGTLLSREQYLVDISSWGYKDARLKPLGGMTREQIIHWTAAIAHK